MPKYGDQQDAKDPKEMFKERAVDIEQQLQEAKDTLIAYQEASAKAEQEYLATINKEREARRDAESKAFRAEVALQEVLKHVTKIK